MQHLVYTAGYISLADWQHAQAIAVKHHNRVAMDNNRQDDKLHQASLAAFQIRFEDC